MVKISCADAWMINKMTVLCEVRLILVQNGINSDAMVAEFWSFAAFYDKKGRMKKREKFQNPRISARTARFRFFLSLMIPS